MNFSVLMSVYIKDDAVLFDKALDSILVKQTTLPTELVLVEDGKLTDDLYAVIEKYKQIFPHIVSVKNETNMGLGLSLQKGILQCSHELIARMDSDDLSTPDRFEKQLNAFANDSELDICGAWLTSIDKDDNILSVRKRPELDQDIKRYALFQSPVCHAVAMYKKSAVLAAGNYQHFLLFEDYYLWIRMILKGAKFHNIQESLYLVRWTNQTNLNRGGLKHALNEVRFQIEILKMGFTTFPIFLKNVVVRGGVKAVPSFIRELVYKNFIYKDATPK